MPRLSVQRLFDERGERLGLSWAAGRAGASREITGEMFSRPDVGLIGHLNLIHSMRVQVLGERESAWFAALEPGERAGTARRIVGGETACVLACDAIPIARELLEAAEAAGTPVLSTASPSQVVVNTLRPFMQGELGAVTELHGVFLDVLEIGVLITGESSVGKSELALELISRGHGLVADDVVELQQIAADTLQGRCPPLLRDFLEVRGLGVLNIRSIFGETAVRPRKVLRLVVHLEPAVAREERERLASRSGTREILGVAVPTVTLTVAPGRNLAVLVEAAVRNHILLTRGIDSTKEFVERQAAAMRGEGGEAREP